MKKIFALLAVISLVMVLVACGEKEEVKTSGEVDTIVEAPAEEVKPSSKPAYKEKNPYVANIPNEVIDIYKQKIEAMEEEQDNINEEKLKNPDSSLKDLGVLKYDLVFINDDNIPELVVNGEGAKMRLYTYDSGEVLYALDTAEDVGWPFESAGNAGYEFLPRENAVRNFNSDFSGLIRYVFFHELDEATHKLVSKYSEELYEAHYDDKNNNNEIDDDERDEYIEEARYFYGDKVLSGDEWATYNIEGSYEVLEGTKKAEEILKLLNSLINEK